MKRTYAILGTGAVGGYYGGVLAHAGHEVHFLFRSDAQHVRQHGLIVETKQENFTLSAVNAYDDVRQMPTCDVVIVALKTTQNHFLPELLPPVVKDRGVVLLLQNGIGGEQQVAQALANRDIEVIGGLCFVCSHKVGPGHIRHMDYGLVSLGAYRADEQPGGITAAMRAIAADFEPTQVPITLQEDLVLARWQKLVWNVPYNGLCVVEDTTTDVLMNTSGHLQHVIELMREVQAGCRAATGRAIEDAFIEKMLDNTRRMTPYAPSMKLDHDAGRAMEVEAMYGQPVRRAEAAGCAVPRMRALYERLSALSRLRLSDVPR